MKIKTKMKKYETRSVTVSITMSRSFQVSIPKTEDSEVLLKDVGNQIPELKSILSNDWNIDDLAIIKED